ncbi:MAG: FAD-binding oxidoreductase, partial [Alphaproteobacteria bacterium]|nr:FAD-binding oxidoreductase [Alphaproteobacteria bacterium]
MSLADDLKASLGEAAVLTGPAIGSHHLSDQSGTGHALPAILVRPRSTAEVAAALRIC